MIHVGITSRHHGTWPAIRYASHRDISYTEVKTLPVGTRFWKRHRRMCNFFHSFAPALQQEGIDILHSYQKALLTKSRWVVSHDALMPCYRRPYLNRHSYRWVFSRLAREECRAILPRSQSAYCQLVSRSDGMPHRDEVIAKAKVVYSAAVDIPEFAEACYSRDINKEIHLLFVGRQFFQKGGHLAVKAFQRLRGALPLRMTVVSSLDPTDWTTPREPGSITAWTMLMDELGVRHFGSLPNEEVRQLMAESDILLLPSLDETFGNVLVEALATGLPVIGTSIRAIPEVIEHGSTGLLIECNTDNEGRLLKDGAYEAEIEEDIVANLLRMTDNSDEILHYKRNARQAYLKRFQVGRLAEDLLAVYRAALA